MGILLITQLEVILTQVYELGLVNLNVEVEKEDFKIIFTFNSDLIETDEDKISYLESELGVREFDSVKTEGNIIKAVKKAPIYWELADLDEIFKKLKKSKGFKK